MRILFLTDNFPPEVNAPATRTFEHCKEWVKKGASVTVITCNPNFPKGEIFEGYKNKFYQKETIEGIVVVRVWSYISANKGFLKRVLDFVSYAISAFIVGLWFKADVIIATSPQFFTAIAGRWLSFFKRTPWIMEVRDIWPESIKAVGALSGDSWVYKRLEKLELRLYRSAAKIVVVTDTFKAIITARGISADKIAVIKNGVDLSQFKPIPKDTELLAELGLEDKFIIGYIGTHGLAHALDFVLHTVARIQEPRIHFLFLGDGAEKEKLVALREALQLSNVTMLPFVSKTEVRRYISILDVSLVNLKKSKTFETVIPSKIFENAAMQKPVLLGVKGESKRIIESYGAGLCYEPEQEEQLLSCINELYTDSVRYNDCKEGCLKLAENFRREVLAQKMLETVKTII